MKQKHKLLAVFLFLSFILAGCSTQKSTDSTDTESMQKSSVSSTEAAARQEITRCVPATASGYYSSDVYFPSSKNITYVDFASQTETFLCAQPNCAHNTTACPSYYPDDGKTQVSGVQVAGNWLLVLQCVATEKGPAHIDKLSLDGGSKSQLIAFGANQSLPGAQIEIEYYTDGDSLYFILSDIDRSTTTTQCSLVRVSLSDGTLETIHKFESAFCQVDLCGASGRKLFYHLADIQSVQDVADSYGSIDVDSGEMEQLPYTLTDTFGVEIRDDNLYGIDFTAHSVFCRNITADQQIDCSFADLYAQVTSQYGDNVAEYVLPLRYSNHACMIEYSVFGGETSGFQLDYILDLETGKTTPFALYKSYNQTVMQIVAPVGDNSVLVQKDWRCVPVNAEDGTSYELYLPEWIIVSMSDYLRSDLSAAKDIKPISLF